MGKTNPKYYSKIIAYNKAHYKRINIYFRTDDDSDMALYEKIKSQPSYQAFVKGMLKEKLGE